MVRIVTGFLSLLNPKKNQSRFGADNFQESMKIAHRAEHHKIDWESFRYMAFDIPTSKGSYSERYAELSNYNIPFLYLALLILKSKTTYKR